jgi:hypothetical protein
MLLQPISTQAFVGTTTLFFAIVNALKLPGLIAADIFDSEVLLNTWWAMPAVPLGVYLGRRIIGRIDTVTFERLMLGLLLAAALLLLR